MTTNLPACEQVESDGTTVWVHGGDGLCLGRFGQSGVDIYRRSGEYSEHDKRFVAHVAGKPDAMAWKRFVALMESCHGIEVASDPHRPLWLEGDEAMPADEACSSAKSGGIKNGEDRDLAEDAIEEATHLLHDAIFNRQVHRIKRAVRAIVEAARTDPAAVGDKRQTP